jgi:hypothetical protein
MTEEAVVEQTVIEETQVEVKQEETPDPKKFKRIIQPKDKSGNPVGSPHVYYGATEQEVSDKMADAIASGTLKIRELSLKEKMEAGALKVPEGAELDDHLPAPKPRELTADERFKVSEKLKDPSTVVEGYRELHQAVTGRTPEEDAKAKEILERDAAISAIKAEGQAFCESHPEYFSTPTNGKIIASFLAARKLAMTKKNFEIAFVELSSDGLLETFPEEPEPEVVPVKQETKPVVAEVTPRTEAPVTKGRTAFPSGLSRDQASGTGTAKPKKPSPAEIAMYSSDKLRAYLESEGKWGR